MSQRPPSGVLFVGVALLVLKGLPLLVLSRGLHPEMQRVILQAGRSPAGQLLLALSGVLPELVAAIAILSGRNWGRVLYLVVAPLLIVFGQLRSPTMQLVPVEIQPFMGILTLLCPSLIYLTFLFILTRPAANAFFAREASTPSATSGGPLV